jgi:hypothetical protein
VSDRFPAAATWDTVAPLMVKSRSLAPTMLAALTLAACGGPTPPAAQPNPTVTVTPVVSLPTASASATAAVAPTAPDEGPMVRLHPVAKVYSLIDVTATEGTLEVRLGHDPGGGMIGRYRYAPLVNGAIDLDQETDEVMYVNTASDAGVHLAGKRPNLLRHAAAGFRSAASDRYEILGDDGRWQGLSVPEGNGVGWEFFTWSEGRILERRFTSFPSQDGDMVSQLPDVRVIRGANKEGPSLPAALKKRLNKEGFYTLAVTAFRTGEVIAVGNLASDDTKLATLLWKDKPKSPEYFETAMGTVKGGLDGEILGGDSLSTVRLLSVGQVLKLEGSSWVVESKVEEGELPDVWFGAPQVKVTNKGAFARTAAGSPWLPLAVSLPDKTTLLKGDQYERSFAVDASGVIWSTFDDMLVSSKQPVNGVVEITEADIVKRRKASVLRGGSNDVTNEPADSGATSTCTTHYVLLDKRSVSPESDTLDYPAIRKALAGHTELGGVKLVVSREKGIQLFGAQTGDEKVARKVVDVVKKSVKGAPVSELCAVPVALREVKVDLATGEIAK